MKLLKQICLVLSAAMLFVACEPKNIDLYEPYKDITIVYGLLNPADSLQYVKIYKAFLGSGDALVYAQNPDSIYYPSGDIKVTVIGYKKDANTNKYVFQETFELKDTIINATENTGVFTNKNNRVWCTHKKILGDNRKYEIIIKNLKSGKEVKGETEMVNLGTSNIVNFRPSLFTGQNTDVVMFDENGKSRSVNISFNNGSNANLFDLTMTLNYIEYPQNSKKDSVQKSIEYSFTQTKSEVAQIQYKLTGSQVLSFLKTRLNSDFADKSKYRNFRKISFHLDVASKEFTKYMEINAPKASYIMDKPLYTNMINGYGIFSNRYGSNSKKYQFDIKTLKAFEDSLPTSGIRIY